MSMSGPSRRELLEELLQRKQAQETGSAAGRPREVVNILLSALALP